MIQSRLFILLLLLIGTVLNAQVTNKGYPYSWDMKTSEKKRMTPEIMETFDLSKLRKEDEVNDKNKSGALRFGYELEVNLGLTNAGVWDELPSGKGRIWRLNIVSKGAQSLNFIFDSYDLPKGATIYIYNEDRSDLLGAYTDVFNNSDGMLGTWMVEGDRIWIEYFEPKEFIGKGSLNIATVVHGYRSFTNDLKTAKDLENSQSCNFDVKCSLGNDIESFKNRLKHAVVRIVQGGHYCTGTLINNTKNDASLYVLTANHCNNADESTWVFRFNWISSTTSCGTEVSSEDIVNKQTTSRAVLLASNTESDFKLIELDGGVDDAWELEWAGWDRGVINPDFTFGIHHPKGDIMKACRSKTKPLIPQKFLVGDIPDPIDLWIVQQWELGVTEKGSSGSALFDPNGRIIGVLSGGAADCNGLIYNGGSDYYGRFDTSWDYGGNSNSRLSDWLDPIHSGRETLDMISLEKPLGIPPIPKQKVDIYYKLSDNTLNITNDSNKTFRYLIYSVLGQKLNMGTLSPRATKAVSLNTLVNGVYFVNITNTGDGSSFTKKIMILK